MFKPILFGCLLLLFYLEAVCQQDLSAFTVTGSGLSTTLSPDYQSIGINAANLGLPPERKAHAGFLETGLSLYSPAIRKNMLMKGFAGQFSDGEKVQAARDFTDKGLAINMDLMWLGIGLQINKIGGFGFSIRDHASSYMILNSTFSDILFNGKNAAYFDQKSGDISSASDPKPISEITDGSKISLVWYREFNLAYGRELFGTDDLKFYGGGTIRAVLGYALLDLVSKNGELTANAAFTPGFKINYPNQLGYNSGGDYFQPAGQGVGADLGLSAEYKEKLRVGVGLNNIGSITWTTNVLTATDQDFKSTNSSGLNNYNLFFQSGKFVGDSGMLKWKGQSSYTTRLPANLRSGAMYKVLDNLRVGADVYVPLNDAPGNLEKAQISVGGEFRIVGFKLSTGVSIGGNSGFNIPLGIVFAPYKGAWEAGFASRDLVTYFTNSSPNLSAVFGFLRFGFM